MTPLLGAEMACISPLALPSQGLFVGGCGLVAAGCGIVFEFARNRRANSLLFSSNARKTDVLPHERVDLVSFFLGQVFVGHGAR